MRISDWSSDVCSSDLMILGQSPRLMAAGIVAYGTTQFLNVTIFSKLRGREGAGAGTTWLAIRGAIASALSQIVDTLLFVTIAFYGVFPIDRKSTRLNSSH